MKKTYIVPTSKLVKIQPAKVIANSLPQGREYQSGDVVLSRSSRYTDWDEEE